MTSLAAIPLEDLIGEIARRKLLLAQADSLLAGHRPDIRRALAATAHAFGLSADDLFAQRRRTRITTARHCAIALLRSHLSLTWQEIADVFSLDHSSCIHAEKAHTARLAADAGYLTAYISIRRALSTPAS